MKKSQIALLCLTAVIMLAVWYIKSPIGVVKPGEDDNVPASKTSTRLEAIENMREALRNERSIETANLDKVIASSTSTLTQKREALSEKEAISDLTEKEVVLELAVINLGYVDCFVHKTSSEVEVLVVASELSELEVIEIMNLTMNSFSMNSVTVTYQAAEEFKAS